jgi:WD40 repeat protein
MSADLELEHAIGFSGGARSPLHVHPSGTEMAYASGACVVIGDVNDPHKQSFLRGHDDLVSCLAMSSSGRFLISAQTGENADVIVWDWASRQLIYRMQEHDHGVLHVSITDDERFLLTVGVTGDDKMVVWDLTTGCIVANKPNMEVTTCACWGGRKKNIKGRDTTEFLIATGGQRSLKIWTLDPATGGLSDERVNLGNQVRNFTRLAFAPSRDYLYAASSSGDFSAVHVRNLMMHSVTQACSNGVFALFVQVSPNGDDQIVVGGGDGSLSIFEGGGRSYRKAAEVQLDGPVSAVMPVGGPTTYVAGTARGLVYHVELSSGKGRAKPLVDSHFEPVCGVAYAPDDSACFATCSHDGTVRVWDVSDYTVTARGACQTSIVGNPLCIGFTGEILLTGWRDGQMRAHDAENGELLWSIDNCHRGGVTALKAPPRPLRAPPGRTRSFT